MSALLMILAALAWWTAVSLVLGAAWAAVAGIAGGLWLVRCHLPDRRAAREAAMRRHPSSRHTAEADLATIRACWDASAQWHERSPREP